MNDEVINKVLDNFTCKSDFYDEKFKRLFVNADRLSLSQFEMLRLEHDLQEKAESVGIKSREFTKLVKACKEPEQTDLQSLPDDQNRTQFPGQQMEMKCRRYICNESGVIFVADNGQVLEIISHPIMPVKRFVNIDTGLEKIELMFKRGRRDWESVTVQKKTIASNTAIVDVLSNCGIEVHTENAKYVVKFLSDLISENYNEIPVQSDTNRLGWMGDTFIPYNGDIAFNDLDSDEFLNKFISISTQQGTLDTWRSTVQIKRTREEENLPFRVALAASFASPLAEKFGIPPFVVHMFGKSGSGKTVTLQTASSVWACPTYGDPLQWWDTLNTTLVGLENLAAFAHNLPVCLDERQGAGGVDLSTLVYLFCEGKGRNRAKKNGGNRKTKYWRNILICNGEQLINSSHAKEGEKLRVIDLMFADQMFKTASEAAAFADPLINNYGHAGKEFITQFMQEDRDQLRKRLDELVAEINKTASGRQSRSGALLVLADELAEKYIFQDGIRLTVEEISKFLKSDREVDINVQIYREICDWLVINRSKLIDKARDPNGAWVPNQIYGKIDDNDSSVVYIVPSKLKQEIFDAHNYEWELFRKWAVEQGVIIRHPTKSEPYRTETKVSIPGDSKNKKNMIEFHTDALQDDDEDEDHAPVVPAGMTQVEMDESDLPF